MELHENIRKKIELLLAIKLCHNQIFRAAANTNIKKTSKIFYIIMFSVNIK